MKEQKCNNKSKVDKNIPEKIYPVIDTDLARDNIQNDIPAADLNDLDK